MKHYGVDEFNGTTINCSDTLKDIVDKKIDVLNDFGLVDKDSELADRVRKMLKQCGTEAMMTIVLHDVLRGKTTLDQLLTEKGVI